MPDTNDILLWLGNDSRGVPLYLNPLNLVWSPEGSRSRPAQLPARGHPATEGACTLVGCYPRCRLASDASSLHLFAGCPRAQVSARPLRCFPGKLVGAAAGCRHAWHPSPGRGTLFLRGVFGFDAWSLPQAHRVCTASLGVSWSPARGGFTFRVVGFGRRRCRRCRYRCPRALGVLVFSQYPPPPNNALQRTEAGVGICSEFQP